MSAIRAAAATAVILFAVAPAPAAAAPACGPLAPNPGGIGADPELAKRLDRMIGDFLKSAALTPGVSVGVVRGGGLVYARGFGHRDLEQCRPADERTRYYLKSTTKSFLGMAAALLDELGEIDLAAPISDYLPELELPTGVNPAQVSLEDHFTHTQPYLDGGLNYRTAFPGNLPEVEFVAHVNRYTEADDIRFEYSNFGPIIGAHAIQRRTGLGWRDLIARRVFAPAGMSDSFTSIAQAEGGSMAVAYLRDEGGAFAVAPTKNDAQMNAAGGAVSTVADLGRWLALNLNRGRIDGHQVFPERAVAHAQARLVKVDAQFLEFRRFSYGLGLYHADYEGELLLHHFGGETHVSFLPDRGLGVVVLSNAIGQGVAVTHRLAASIYDLLLEKDDLDQRLARRLGETERWRVASQRRWREAVENARRSAPPGDGFDPAELAGRYLDPRLGEMVLSAESGVLSIRYGELGGPLEGLGGGAYLAPLWPWGQPPELIAFRRGADGKLVLDWGGRIFAALD